MAKITDNIKKLRDNIYLRSTITTTGELWVVRKEGDGMITLRDVEDDAEVVMHAADLLDIYNMLGETIEYIEGLPS